ncbi:MAG: hypothetical protein EON96_17590, partial [Caulobacteraceae bacterium]
MKAQGFMLAGVGIALAACQPASQPVPEAPATVPDAIAPSAPAPTTSAPDPALVAFLQARTADAMPPLRYVARTTGEGADALTLVLFSGPEYCGSGGCNLLILSRQGDTFTVLGRQTIVRAPIRVLSTETGGRPDIGVRIAGGGVTEGYEALLA